MSLFYYFLVHVLFLFFSLQHRSFFLLKNNLFDFYSISPFFAFLPLHSLLSNVEKCERYLKIYDFLNTGVLYWTIDSNFSNTKLT